MWCVLQFKPHDVIHIDGGKMPRKGRREKENAAKKLRKGQEAYFKQAHAQFTQLLQDESKNKLELTTPTKFHRNYVTGKKLSISAWLKRIAALRDNPDAYVGYRKGRKPVLR